MKNLEYNKNKLQMKYKILITKDENITYRNYRNKRPGRLICRSNKKAFKNHRFCVLPPLKNHPLKVIGFVCSPFEKSPIKSHRFCVLPPLKNHPSKAIGFVYSPLCKVIHQKPLVLCTPPFEKSPINTHRFCVLPPLKNHCFWWALISGWTFISVNTVYWMK